MKPRIMLISSVPMTLWVFYRVLIEKLQSDGYDLTVVSSPAEELSRIRDCFGCRTPVLAALDDDAVQEDDRI
ncbi:MAG TPA: hypothetical protein P5279_05370, partial [Anaerohalosphaeraceae bacterium]|nr:hypothetical protein [Anaerohalosphaeraceae bacterium]HRT49901.1 hypothetical protein [Anaerohalosphaeraceae bacterium]HRT86793.1 hypothetical protein [Anaerohalosphaeraceae bacterium]